MKKILILFLAVLLITATVLTSSAETIGKDFKPNASGNIGIYIDLTSQDTYYLVCDNDYDNVYTLTFNSNRQYIYSEFNGSKNRVVFALSGSYYRLDFGSSTYTFWTAFYDYYGYYPEAISLFDSPPVGYGASDSFISSINNYIHSFLGHSFTLLNPQELHLYFYNSEDIWSALRLFGSPSVLFSSFLWFVMYGLTFITFLFPFIWLAVYIRKKAFHKR